MNLFNKLQNKKSQAVQTSRQQYLQLLTTIDPDNATDKEQARLEALMVELHISPEDAARDHDLIQTALSQTKVANESQAKRKALEDLEAKHQKTVADRLAKIREMDAAIMQLNAQTLAAKTELQLVSESQGYLSKLAEDRPDVFSIIQTKQ